MKREVQEKAANGDKMVAVPADDDHREHSPHQATAQAKRLRRSSRDTNVRQSSSALMSLLNHYFYRRMY